jgi:hypothetical protein
MKKLRLGFISLVLIVVAFGLCACNGKNSDNSGNQENSLHQFGAVTFESAEFIYDGEPHSLAVKGNIPENTNIEYENNEQTNAGVYKISAKLSKDGYESKELSATLTINKAEFNGITLKDKKFVYFGQMCSLAVEGDIPENTQVTYSNNDKTEVGEYTVTATLTNPNYITKTLSAKLTIFAKTDIALSTINRLLDKPNVWSFLPTAFSPENMAYAHMPVGGMADFVSDVQVSQIAKRSIGKQFNVLYEGLINATTVINKIDDVFAIGTTIAEAYQTFINNNPDNYASFNCEIGGFKIMIVLDGKKSVLLACNSVVNIELEYDEANGVRTGRLQLSNGIAVKYTSNDNTLKFAVKTTLNNVGNLKQIEFARDGNSVAGYLREFTGTETKNLKTTGVIASNEKYTIIMSDKRETEDLVIKGYEEVYSSETGEYLSGRVQETVKVVNYDTLWLHLSDVRGFQSVRVDDAANGLNIDSVFVNGQATVFATKKVNPIIPTSSRRFDVEMKEVWYVVAETANGKTEYRNVKTLIPMLFVQTEQTDNFTVDVKEKNSYIANAQLPSEKIDIANLNYDSLNKLFNEVKDKVTFAEIQAYIGNKNEFFNVVS